LGWVKKNGPMSISAQTCLLSRTNLLIYIIQLYRFFLTWKHNITVSVSQQ